MAPGTADPVGHRRQGRTPPPRHPGNHRGPLPARCLGPGPPRPPHHRVRAVLLHSRTRHALRHSRTAQEGLRRLQRGFPHGSALRGVAGPYRAKASRRSQHVPQVPQWAVPPFGRSGAVWARENWGLRHSPGPAGLSLRARRLTTKARVRRLFVWPLEEAELLRGVRDEQVLRLLVVQQPHCSDQGKCCCVRLLGGVWAGNGPDLGPVRPAPRAAVACSAEGGQRREEVKRSAVAS